jgi:hypothetical protein
MWPAVPTTTVIRSSGSSRDHRAKGGCQRVVVVGIDGPDVEQRPSAFDPADDAVLAGAIARALGDRA